METTRTAPAARAPSARRPSRMAAFAWFAAMVAGWIVFFSLLAFDEPALHELRADVRELGLVLEGLVWLAFFPFVLALAIWTSAWDEGLRVALVACCAIGWSLAFYPWRRPPKERRR